MSASVHAGIYSSGSRHHPSGADTPRSRHPPEQTPLLGADTTPREADSSTRSTSGRYASYWNAFLSLINLLFSDSIIVVVAVEILGCHGYPYSMTYAELTSVPVSIPAEATSVDLRQNRITNLTSGVFSHLSVCTKLNLTVNQISVIEPGAFTGLQTLTKLDLSNNSISILEDYMFSPLTTLEELDLSFNHIATISFKALTHLRILHLQHNYLTEIPTHALSTVPKLMELRLSYNLLSTLKSDVFTLDNRPYTMTLYLNGNPLLCESDLCWLKTAVESGSINLPSNPTCGRQGDWYCTSGTPCCCLLIHWFG